MNDAFKWFGDFGKRICDTWIYSFHSTDPVFLKTMLSRKHDKHLHTKDCIRYGNIDIHYYCSQTHEEISDAVAKYINSEELERMLVKDLDRSWEV